MSKDYVLDLKCWKNRRVVLHRSTLLNHVLRLHLESAFVVDAMKSNFKKPICVIHNKQHKTENAIFDIPYDGKKWLLVAIKFQGHVKKLRQPSFIKSFYLTNDIPNGPVIWGTKP